MHDDSYPVDKSQAERDRIALHNYERDMSAIDGQLRSEAEARISAEHDGRRESRIRRFGRRITGFVMSPKVFWLTIRDARDDQSEE